MYTPDPENGPFIEAVHGKTQGHERCICMKWAYFRLKRHRSFPQDAVQPESTMPRAGGHGARNVAIIVGAIVFFVVFFFLAPIVSFQCNTTLYPTSGSVSLSCEALGFGEITQQAFGTSGSGWSNDCQIPTNSLFAQCSVGAVFVPILSDSGVIGRLRL